MRGRLPVTGSYTGDGSNAVAIDLGFRPAKVEIYNVTDGDTYSILLDDGSAGVHLKFVNHDTAQLAVVSSNEGSISPRGFNTGTDASIIESAKVYQWIAF